MASTDPAAPRALHIALVEPEIHWNTGNTGRTSLAVGAQLHLVRPLGFSLDERQVRRAGLDYWPRVAPRVWPDWSSFEAALPQIGSPYFVSPEGLRDYWDVEFEEQVVLLFGRESVGFDPCIRERYAERCIRLPMLDPELRSVNVSTCAGIVSYEVRRQWARRS